MKMSEFKKTSYDYLLRIEKIDERGKMERYFIKEFPNRKEYLPIPSDVWINESAEFFVPGTSDFGNFSFKKRNFIKVKLP